MPACIQRNLTHSSSRRNYGLRWRCTVAWPRQPAHAETTHRSLATRGRNGLGNPRKSHSLQSRHCRPSRQHSLLPRSRSCSSVRTPRHRCRWFLSATIPCSLGKFGSFIGTSLRSPAMNWIPPVWSKVLGAGSPATSQPSSNFPPHIVIVIPQPTHQQPVAQPPHPATLTRDQPCLNHLTK